MGTPAEIYGRGIETLAGDLKVDIERGLETSEAAKRLETQLKEVFGFRFL